MRGKKDKLRFPFDLQLSHLKGCKVKIHWHILWRPETDCFYSAGYRNVSLKRSSNPKSAPRPKYTSQTWNVSPLRRHVSALVFVSKTRRIGLHAEIHSCFLFCLCTHFPGIDNPQTLAPHVVFVHSACTVATSARYNTSTDGSIPVLSRNLLLVTDTRSRALFFVSLTDRLEAPFSARRWHLASRCARDVNERNGEGPCAFPPCQRCIWLCNDGSR